MQSMKSEPGKLEGNRIYSGSTQLDDLKEDDYHIKCYSNNIIELTLPKNILNPK